LDGVFAPLAERACNPKAKGCKLAGKTGDKCQSGVPDIAPSSGSKLWTGRTIVFFLCIAFLLCLENGTGAVIFTHLALVSRFDVVDFAQIRVGHWLESLAGFDMKRPLLRVMRLL